MTSSQAKTNGSRRRRTRNQQRPKRVPNCERFAEPQTVDDHAVEVFWNVCATATFAPLPTYIEHHVDALTADWRGKYIWLNPPIDADLGIWIAKAATGSAELCVCLVPAMVGADWFRKHVLSNPRAEVRFAMGQPPTKACLVIFRDHGHERNR